MSRGRVVYQVSSHGQDVRALDYFGRLTGLFSPTNGYYTHETAREIEKMQDSLRKQGFHIPPTENGKISHHTGKAMLAVLNKLHGVTT